jgi:hypothetical protein
MSNVSPYVLEAARKALNSRPSGLEVSARREQLEASMRAEGAPQDMIERLATDKTAAKMLEYDRKVTDMILSLFGPR